MCVTKLRNKVEQNSFAAPVYDYEDLKLKISLASIDPFLWETSREEYE